MVPCELWGCVNPLQPLSMPWTSVSMTPFKLPSPVQGRLLDGSQTGVLTSSASGPCDAVYGKHWRAGVRCGEGLGKLIRPVRK